MKNKEKWGKTRKKEYKRRKNAYNKEKAKQKGSKMPERVTWRTKSLKKKEICGIINFGRVKKSI